MALTPEQLEWARANGYISPDAYAMATAPAASVQAPAPPPPPQIEIAPPAPLFAEPQVPTNAPPVQPPPPDLSAAFAAKGLALAPPQPAPAAPPEPTDADILAAGRAGTLRSAGAKEPAPAQPAPRGDVAMGPLTRPDGTSVRAPAPAAAVTPRPAPGPAAPTDPRASIAAGQVARLDEQKALAEDRTNVARARAVEEADAAAAIGEELEQRKVARQAARAAEEQAWQAKAHEADAMAMQAAQETDPDKFWKDRGGLSARVIGAIAVGLNELGSAMTKSNSNAALSMITNGIEQSIRTQEANRDAKGRAADRLSRSADAISSQSRAKDAAFHQDHVIALEQAKQKVAEIAARYGSEEARLNGAALIQGITEKQDAVRDQLRMTKYNEARQAAAAAAAARAAAEKEQFRRGEVLDKSAQEWAKINAETAKNGGGLQVAVPGADGKPTVVTAASAKDAEELRKKAEVYSDLRGTIADLKKMREEHGRETGIDGAVKARAKGLTAKAMLRLKDLQELGALTKDDLKMVTDQIPTDPNDIWSRDSTITASYDTAIGELDRGFQASLNARTKVGTAVPNVTAEQRARNATVRTTSAPGEGDK